VIIATAGHVDHGKTSLVRALTGIDTDRLPEEKRRGLTIDLGFAYVDLPGGARLGFVDVPGHHRFVANMVAGVTGVGAALVVVAADDGVMPQTEEHIAILDLLGLDTGVVAITKADRVEEHRLAEVRAAIAGLLEGSTLARLPMIATSTETGAGIEALKAELVSLQSERIGDGQRFRLAIDRSFVIDGAGVILAGPVLSGHARLGDDLVIMPGGIPVSARGLRVQDSKADRAGPGDRAAIQIGGRDAGRDVARRGDWLCAPDTGFSTRRLDVRLRSARTLEGDLRHDMPVHVHIGAADIPGRLALLDRRRLAPRDEAWAQVVLEREVSTVRGDRLVLRDQSAQATIAGGWVVDPLGAERGRARPERLETLAAMAQASPAGALLEMLAVDGGPVDLTVMARRWNFTPDAAREAWSDVEIVRLGDLAFDPGHWEDWRRAALAAIDEAHHAHPDRLGLDAPSLAATLRLRRPEARLVLSELVAEGALALAFGTYGRPDHKPQLTPADQSAWEALWEHLGAADQPAEVAHQIAKRVEIEPAALLALLGRLEARGLVIRVSRNRFLLPETVSALARAAESALAASPDGLTIASFGEHAKVGRNLAVEFLEFLDRKRVTRRVGAHRVVVASAAEIFGL
jgi:selenocysteine-specific elongation factor